MFKDIDAVFSNFIHNIGHKNHIFAYQRLYFFLMIHSSSKFLSLSITLFKLLLEDISEIQATSSAFAALRRDGSVVAWGDEENGGDCSHPAVLDVKKQAFFFTISVLNFCLVLVL